MLLRNLSKVSSGLLAVGAGAVTVTAVHYGDDAGIVRFGRAALTVSTSLVMFSYI